MIASTRVAVRPVLRRVFAPSSRLITSAIVHQGSAPDAWPLPSAAKEHFDRHGFCVVQDFFTPREVQGLKSSLVELVKKGRLANVATDGDGTTYTAVPKNLQLCPLSPEAPIFRSLPFHARARAALDYLLTEEEDRDEGICQYLSQVFWKPPNHGLGTGWHQDNAYFHVPKAFKGTAMWIPVHDAHAANGTLRVMPCDQEASCVTLEHVRDGSSDHHITCKASIDEKKAVQCEVPAGGVVFFNYGVPHTTGENTTSSPRAAVAYHFIHRAHWRERAFPLPEEAEYVCPTITGSACTDGRSEYGIPLDFAADLEDVLRKEPINEIAQEEVVVRSVVQDTATRSVSQSV